MMVSQVLGRQTKQADDAGETWEQRKRSLSDAAQAAQAARDKTKLRAVLTVYCS